MNDLLVAKKLSSMKKLLSAYAKANGGMNSFDALDGGAGWGNTAREILSTLGLCNYVYAFEPFPGNHKFFKSEEIRIKLITKALAECSKSTAFAVPSVVEPDSDWGRKGLAGYSSVGFLRQEMSTINPNDIAVDCCAADDVIPLDVKIGFIKLDLQGGELNALKGMRRLVEEVKLMWIEFTNQPGLIEYLDAHNFMLFDTEYFFMGSVNEKALREFEVSRDSGNLSTGKSAWFGFRRNSWHNFEESFSKCRKEHCLIQTDLVCVNKKYLDEFIKALQYI